jgi:hypothetical protein
VTSMVSELVVGSEGSGAPRRLRAYEIAFGILLPIVCFAADLMLMGVATLAPLALWSFAAFGIIALLLSANPRASAAMRSALVGALGAAAAGAAMIGCALLPLSFITVTIFGLGLLGLVPFATTFIFALRAQVLFCTTERRSWPVIWLGAVMMFAVPAGLQYAENRWLAPQLAKLESQDPDQVLAALRALNAYPLTLGRADRRICALVLRPNQNDAIMREAERSLRRKPADACAELLD